MLCAVQNGCDVHADRYGCRIENVHDFWVVEVANIELCKGSLIGHSGHVLSLSFCFPFDAGGFLGGPVFGVVGAVCFVAWVAWFLSVP
jgi:hypothetical protein